MKFPYIKFRGRFAPVSMLLAGLVYLISLGFALMKRKESLLFRN